RRLGSSKGEGQADDEAKCDQSGYTHRRPRPKISRAAGIAPLNWDSRLRTGIGHPLQFELEIACGLPALFGILCEATADRVVEIRRSEWFERDDMGGGFFE